MGSRSRGRFNRFCIRSRVPDQPFLKWRLGAWASSGRFGWRWARTRGPVGRGIGRTVYVGRAAAEAARGPVLSASPLPQRADARGRCRPCPPGRVRSLATQVTPSGTTPKRCINSKTCCVYYWPSPMSRSIRCHHLPLDRRRRREDRRVYRPRPEQGRRVHPHVSERSGRARSIARPPHFSVRRRITLVLEGCRSRSAV